MKEEKYIQSLFEAARQEEPQLSFEEVSETLATSLSPGMGAVMKGWFFKHIYLNSIIVLVSITALSFLASRDLESENKQTTTIPTIENTVALANIEKATPIITEEESPIQNEEKIETISSNELKPRKNTRKVINQATTFVNPAPAKQEIVPNLNTVVSTPSAKKPSANLVQETPEIIDAEPEKEEIKITEQTKAPEVSKIAEAPEQVITNTSNNDTRSELETIIETALNDNELKDELFVINAEGELAQLLILTNGEFNNLVDINFANKKAIVMKNAYDGSFNLLNDDHVNVVEFSVKRKTAILKFIYNSVNVQIDLEKNDDIWVTTNIIRDDNQEEHLEKEDLIQLALNHENMKTLVDRGNDNNYKEFLLIANDFLSSQISVEFANKPLEVVLQKSNHKYNRRAVYAEIRKFQVKRKKAILEISYKGKTSQIVYRKKNEEWHIQSFK